MLFTSIADAKILTGLSYIGQVNNGAKHKKAYKYNELVYTIYFAPAMCSGYEACPGRTPECTAACLNLSGHNRMDIHKNMINNSRVKKTKLFFEEREFTVRWIIQEIASAKWKAKNEGRRFSVRLNNTSDISPEEFYVINRSGQKRNLLQLFPDVQFYDYTKVASRIELIEKYHNYDITYSFNGYNEDLCKGMLRRNVRVAVVFNGTLPKMHMGYPVINADLYDMRYIDRTDVIVGLHYKRVRTKLNSENKFVINNEEPKLK
jgi:hypothetical protein